MFLISLFKKSAFLLGLAVFQAQPPEPTTLSVAPAPSRVSKTIPAKATPINEVDGLLGRIQNYFDGTRSFSGSFEQVSMRVRTGRKSRRSGQVRVMRPNKIRWDFQKPDPVHYVANGDDLWVYQPQDALAYRMKVGDSDLDQAIRFLAGGINLKEAFNAKITDKPEGVTLEKLAYVELLPKEGSASFKKLILGVDPESGAVRFSMIVDPDGNQTRTTYHNLRARLLQARIFEFTPPEGVQVQDLSKRGTSGP
jgi:outer membrane lipoprotein carrier protein